MEQKKKQNELLEKLTSIEALLKKRNDKPLNFNQAAEYLGFSYSYLYKLTSRKLIPCHRPTGKVLFFSKDELDEWIFENKESEKELENPTNQNDDEDEAEPP